MEDEWDDGIDYRNDMDYDKDYDDNYDWCDEHEEQLKIDGLWGKI